MNRYDQLFHHADVSEKAIEQALVKAVEKRGGIALKYTNDNLTGYPDRLIILPPTSQGRAVAPSADDTGPAPRVFWAELKSAGRRPTPLQRLRHDQLRALGFKVYTIDNKQQIHEILQSYT